MVYFVSFSPRRVFLSRRASLAPRALFVGFFAALAMPVEAGRPLATDDAAIVEAGACQLEAWVERSTDARGTWLNPGCNPFGRTEFAFGGTRTRPEGESAFSTRQWQVKQLLRGFDAEKTGFAVAVGGSRVLHGEQRQHFLNGIATVPLAGEARVLHLNLGALRTRAEAGDRTRASWGIAFDAGLAHATRASIETFGISGERPSWQLGLRHELIPGHVQIDASIGSALGRLSEARIATFGLVFVSPACLR